MASTKNPAGKSPAIQLFITNSMRQVLVNDLKYYPWEVDVMKPELAAAVIEKGLVRPWGSQTMPESWKQYVKAGTSKSSGTPVAGLVRSLLKTPWTLGVVLPVTILKKTTKLATSNPIGFVAVGVAGGAGAYCAATAVQEKKAARKAPPPKPKGFWVR
mmetsp:Transcript_31821/g.38480  ORF Transcript_31821/g.38480 Transcript_31821/m.38480 type:complete len:158 (-) Transcript_31821:171-644(-)